MTEAVATREFTLTRVFNAPRNLVYRSWTDPDDATHWWGPKNFTTPRDTMSFDVRPGGQWQACMVNDATGEQFPSSGVYREVVPGERLVFTWGRQGDPEEDKPVVTIELTDQGEQTQMVFHLVGHLAEGDLLDMEDGWSECIARSMTHLSR
ncbi:SRPBCC domain-containing protein [Crossiella sp. CA-258035]|uniref:SRPBCC family protein n=1 Tax=Crossiella sp. CA-258035 TaxID=2981138 RepID=UPI0024BCDD2F|nr:SRPBCC domain-containing protein [Crossiella sp. CA-258035]WHT15640.1 SRPBCC domain-containing protein [Crossiella sp. CA-258035]